MNRLVTLGYGQRLLVLRGASTTNADRAKFKKIYINLHVMEELLLPTVQKIKVCMTQIMPVACIFVSKL